MFIHGRRLLLEEEPLIVMARELTETADRFRSDLLLWAETNLREFPWRDDERTLYEVFIAEFFLTQTPANNVARVYPDFLNEFPTLHSIRKSNVDDLERTIRPLGFQRMRAEALSRIASEYDDLPKVPEEMEELTRVGPYVANATLCIACERSLPILDRNVKRVYRRVFGNQFPQGEGNQMEFTKRMLPDDGSTAQRYNLALVDFGALVCEKLEPICEVCFAPEYCSYYEEEVDV